MDFKSNHSSPVLTDPVPLNKARLGIAASLLPYSPSQTGFSSGLHWTCARKKFILSKLDDARASGWLDAMRSSSPPRKRFVKDVTSVEVMDPEAKDACYQSWTLKYPSALSVFEQIVGSAKGKQLALFLDYDGTLSPIVDDPDRAFMSNTMRAAVRDVAELFPTAIISGRCRDQVFDFVGLTELYYAGSHGMDILGPVKHSKSPSLVEESLPNCIRTTDKQGKEVNLFQPAKEFIPMIEEVFELLVKNTKGIKGVKVENHKFCASVHYRRVDEEDWVTVAQCVINVLKGYPRLRITHGRKVLEIRPKIDWNKGKAVEFLLDSLDLTDSNNVLPIYIGDDRTDEDAFKVLRESNRGYGMLVSALPKETNAFYSLRDPSEVMEFLKCLARWKKGRV
ncbi:hypothetical protein AMTRI_Chr03g46870 [Amborella trichopoda]|uniref:Trehalose 6-phosphate phosphatase n=1 Tax=Amborella trichopoda TaxID=13333 RepID=W1P6L8_AMBTC|nr:probable trehalose-phosphate phosphatase G [Amborella trichopoda]XP_020520840.1 probable trehalose-phosphate phosphatase G [Amborella trichopoda]XP_020520841.1 probable trehalose-phosphate phosphatase G [Amborella trichopoda]ERN02630.1 hypothetical protein AMTR_s00085p00016590 [Amborella trichopoda]|eukprot:XP_006840955.1 probable trehalose-phosphate phosphatase G [Amborella trichopoda]